ncbi:MAG TPA: hypothetical protein HPP76_08215 [Desulfuromonadales bacterium]|nr:hypothetical protein [Desulfuromonadales bacterium]
MSYILDALKKIEREKARKVSSGGIANLSGDLFNERTSRSGGRPAGRIFVLVLLVTVVVCSAGWFLLGGNGKQKTASQRAITKAAAPASPAPAPAPVISQAPIPSPPPIPQPVPQAVPQPVQMPQTPAGSAGVTAPPAPSVAAVSAEEDAPAGKKRGGRTPKRESESIRPTVQAPAEIKLSGIAWQDERAGRRAVINDFLLREGSVVAGARITEILADRVKFSAATGVFEIRLNAVLPVEQKR